MSATLTRPDVARQALHWVRSNPRYSAAGAVAALLLTVTAAVVADPAGSLPRLLTPEERALAEAPPPTPEPMLVKAVAPDQALQINAAIPVAGGPNPAARPFNLSAGNTATYSRALECLTEAIYYEAATEPTDGQRAVAQVVLNRVRHPAYPASVCGVVYQGHERPTGCQFTFTCDGSLNRAPMQSYWNRAREVAKAALDGSVYAPVGNATHYHTNYVVPYWASSLVKAAVVGTHIFYRWSGGWGQPAAFGQRYATSEADPAALRRNALAAEARYAALAPNDTVAEAKLKQELPPELAKLVDAEIGPKGQTRVSLRASPAAKVAARKATENLVVEREQRSSNLDWALTGSGAEQKGLGAQPANTSAPATAPGAQ
ncbi:cell wall hydrolase [Sphingomonas arenae]|uniref:cell wall hydrolase n=1 Tax=Sphingomonas arenae TaxID=2812555 RepID=UPI001F437113|nr:cell wall hydrolase [Sphingomonas arenae]